MLASSIPTLYRAVIFCGSTPDSGLENIRAPLLAHYAQFDSSVGPFSFQITGNAVWTKMALNKLGKRFTYYVYPKTFHEFFDETSKQFDPEAYKLAWARTLEFLRSPSRIRAMAAECALLGEVAP